MKKKGFTLIELIGVILVMGIIALIAIPTITSVISDSKKGSLKSTVQNLISSVENNCSVEKINGQPQTYIYKLTEQGIFPNTVSMKGKLPTSGYVYVDGECVAEAINLSDGENYINGDNENIDIQNQKKNISPIENATSNYMFAIEDVEAMPEIFDISSTNINEPEINGVIVDSNNNVIMSYWGFSSRDLDKDRIEKFVNDLKEQEVLISGIDVYDQIYYYINYEKGYSCVFSNICSIVETLQGAMCNNNTPVLTALGGFESDEEFLENNGIIYRFQ